jgi:DNA (cytosine-5)-methyltransferase 1
VRGTEEARMSHELVVDNFAGGGGASTGIEAALGRPVDFAINHDPEAVAMHAANHPHTTHFCESVWDVNPRQVVRGRSMGLGWFSPDCTFHSKARGGKPFRERNPARRRRGLAWLVVPWIKAAQPRVIMLENVEEFADWGPLLEDGRPCPLRRGLTFRRWHRRIENLGYQIDMRELRACDYAAPTTRKRLFVIARRDGREIVFPNATHGAGLQPYRTAAECIDWSIPCPSIFTPGRNLCENTLRRIARGVQRYVIDDPNPFIVTARGTSDWHIDSSARSIDDPLRTVTAGRGVHHNLVVPTLINTRNGERVGQAPRVRDIREPYPTVTAIGSQGALVTAFLARHYGGHENDGASLRAPLHTITTKDHHALVYAFLLKYYGTDQNPRLDRPLHTITTRDRFALVTVHGEPHYIADIGMRHLVPRELFLAQSFPRSYVIDPIVNGKPLSKTAQIRMCGNSVPPVLAEALVRENVVEQSERAEAA